MAEASSEEIKIIHDHKPTPNSLDGGKGGKGIHENPTPSEWDPDPEIYDVKFTPISGRLSAMMPTANPEYLSVTELPRPSHPPSSYLSPTIAIGWYPDGYGYPIDWWDNYKRKSTCENGVFHLPLSKLLTYLIYIGENIPTLEPRTRVQEEQQAELSTAVVPSVASGTSDPTAIDLQIHAMAETTIINSHYEINNSGRILPRIALDVTRVVGFILLAILMGAVMFAGTVFSYNAIVDFRNKRKGKRVKKCIVDLPPLNRNFQDKAATQQPTNTQSLQIPAADGPTTSAVNENLRNVSNPDTMLNQDTMVATTGSQLKSASGNTIRRTRGYTMEDRDGGESHDSRELQSIFMEG
jgi:hypothetical protein